MESHNRDCVLLLPFGSRVQATACFPVEGCAAHLESTAPGVEAHVSCSYSFFPPPLGRQLRGAQLPTGANHGEAVQHFASKRTARLLFPAGQILIAQ